MELTTLQKTLINLIMGRGVVKEQMVAMMLFLKDNEELLMCIDDDVDLDGNNKPGKPGLMID